MARIVRTKEQTRQSSARLDQLLPLWERVAVEMTTLLDMAATSGNPDFVRSAATVSEKFFGIDDDIKAIAKARSEGGSAIKGLQFVQGNLETWLNLASALTSSVDMWATETKAKEAQFRLRSTKRTLPELHKQFQEIMGYENKPKSVDVAQPVEPDRKIVSLDAFRNRGPGGTR